jgi:hypothetical protein
MATEKEAHKAREAHSDFLRELGAHAIAVDQIKRGDDKAFGVIALVEKKPASPFPESLEIKSGKKTVEVPLTLRVSPKARLE